MQIRIDYQVTKIPHPLTYVLSSADFAYQNIRPVNIRLGVANMFISKNRQKNWLPDVSCFKES